MFWESSLSITAPIAYVKITVVASRSSARVATLVRSAMISSNDLPMLLESTEAMSPSMSLRAGQCRQLTDLGWGLLSQFSPFRYFPHFPLLSKQTLAIEYHVYIWQVSPQLSCCDTCQIWMWFRESNRYFARSKILLTEKLANGALVTPTPGPWQFSITHLQLHWHRCRFGACEKKTVLHFSNFSQ